MFDIDIAVCGTTATGKTTHLAIASAQEGFGQDRVYSLAVKDPEQAAELGGLAEQLYSSRGADRAMPGTKVMKPIDYRMTLLRGGQALADVSWYDYAGGALSQAGGDTLKVVAERARRADAMVLYLDGRAVLEMDSGEDDDVTDLKFRWGLNKYKPFIEKLAERAREQGERMPVVVVLSKFDLLLRPGAPGWDDPRIDEYLLLPLEEIRQRVKRLFDSLFAKDNAVFRCFIVPLSMGRDVGETLDGPGRISPLRPHRPIGAAVYEALSRRRRIAQRELEAARSAAGRAQASLDDMGVLDTIVDDLFRGSRLQRGLRDDLGRARSAGCSAEARLRELKARLDGVLPLVEGLRVVEGHEEWRIRADGGRPSQAVG
jgi:hypothetical protein